MMPRLSILRTLFILGLLSSGAPRATPCPKGTMLTVEKTCERCGPGKFSWRLDSKKCDDCPAGSESIENRTTCVACPPGKVGSGGDGGVCKACLEGEIAPKPRAITCQVCIAGKTSSPIVGGTKCVNCESGRYSESKNEGCFDCPDGTYSPTEGASNGCQPCPEGLAECDRITGELLEKVLAFSDIEVSVDGSTSQA